MSNIDVIKQLDYNKKFLHEKDVQEELRAFVTNKNNPLDERFRVWSEHCDKKEERWIIHKGQYGVIGQMVDTNWPMEYDKYRVYTFDDFIEYVEDYHEDEEDEYNKPDGFKIPSNDELKEMLIKTNFGSFTMDW